MPDPNEQPSDEVKQAAKDAYDRPETGAEALFQRGAEATYAQEAAEHPGETYAEQADRVAREAQAAEDAAPPMRITDTRIGHMATLAATGAEVAFHLREAARAASAMRAIYAEVCQTFLTENEIAVMDALSQQGQEKFKDSVADFTVQMLIDKAIEKGVIPESERGDWDYLAAIGSGESQDEFADRLNSLQERIEQHDLHERVQALKDSGNPLAALLGL